ncbi:MAG: type II secretion system protein GspE [Omnitrophica WOR_2 bacterium RIFCSPHIGHO2_02_FULL_50_17]|nr:MAG: type II secretion system protein GspE [Omnitrophica WOR_2 bacterium RIFCSPHIGHO2_02_FULL_50_17]
MPRREKKSLGEWLLEQGVITSKVWQEAQEEERKTGRPLRKVLVEKGAISEEDMVSFLARQMDIPRIELSNYLIDTKVIDCVPEVLARKYQLIPILKIGRNVTCAMADPMNIFALDEVRMNTGLTVEPAVSTEAEIKKALDEYYGVRGSMEEVIKGLDEHKLGIKDGEEVELKRLAGIADEPPVVRLVNIMVMEAVREGASDIHVEPQEESLAIRFRIDGVLYEKESPPKHFQSAIISRIKVLANLDIAERRRPQDGRFHMKMENRQIDLRISCVPTIYGENVVMRLLDATSAVLGLEQLGFARETLTHYRKLVKQAHGIILVTGPTGSGKTTTLYASLNILNTPEKNIITIEDPVEYRLHGIRQIQVNLQADLTFAKGLRSVLRQDPDIIMVGEIRDLETAEIAIQAALTGHLVFATLHTNDAPGAVTRLLDMGIEPYLISSSVIGVIAQRLVRLFCKGCEGKGCKACLNTGYKGRMGIYELMILNEDIRQLITQKSSSEEIRKAAIKAGMKTLREDGLEKVTQKLTSQEEVLRVTQEE